MALWTRKIDPATGGYLIEDGRYVRIPARAGGTPALLRAAAIRECGTTWAEVIAAAKAETGTE